MQQAGSPLENVLRRRVLRWDFVARSNEQSIALIGCDWSHGTPPPGESTTNDYNAGVMHIGLFIYDVFT